MKKSILTISLILFSITIFSQEKKFTTYRVKAKETLSSIARKIGVTTYDLEKLNPDVKNTLHIDEVLIIPNPKFKKTTDKKENVFVNKTSDLKTKIVAYKDSIKNGILYHKVKTGETVYSLSKKYKVKKRKILKWNHLKKRAKIAIGQILKIPTNKPDTTLPKHLIINDVNNSKYNKYIVKPHETKYTLAKLHGLSVDQLEEINPFLKNNVLKEGDEIFLPKKNKNLLEVDVNEIPKENLYTITKEDTFFNFEHHLGYKKETLLALNPQLKDGLKVGMQIKLPTKQKVKEIDNSYKLHKVGFQETFYMLSKNYGVTKEELLILNPELKDGLKEGMVIKIPTHISEQTEDINEMIEGDVAGKNVNLIMLLPFKANQDVDFSNNNKQTDFVNKVTDFYFGALMAIDSLQKKGINISLKVKDTKNNVDEVKNILNTTDFSDTDAVIGPLVYSKFKVFATNFLTDSIPLISPVSKKNHALIFKPNVVQNSPKTEDIEDVMLQYIKDTYNNQNIVIIADEGIEIDPKIEHVKRFLQENDSIKKITVLKLKKNQLKREEFDKVVLKDKENRVILVTNTKKPTTTSVVVNTLGAYPTDYNITLFALEKGRNFKEAALSNKNLNRLKVHFPLVTFVEKTNPNIVNFEQKYINKFGSVPTAFTYKGFDTTYDTAIRIANFKKMDSLYRSGNSYRLADKFKYKKEFHQGYYNKGVHIVYMKNFQFVNAITEGKVFKNSDNNSSEEQKK